MTHAELAKALHLARSTVTRDVAAGMPLNIRGAREWREEHEERDVQLRNSLRQEHRERLLSQQIRDLMWTSPRTVNQENQLVALRAKYEVLAVDVLDDHVEVIEAALNRRLFTCGGFSKDEALEKYVNALSELVEKWQQVLDADDESEDAG
jgi:hypothetical protein